MTARPALSRAGRRLPLPDRVLVGTSGWVYDGWAGSFYPPGLPRSRWLGHYATVFSTVEINATFYRLASVSAVERWRSQVPDDFRFAVKGSRFITHMKRLTDTDEAVQRFFAPLRPLDGSMAVVVWQLPPTLRLDLERLDRFLASLPQEVVHAVEFRHPSWLCPEAFALLDRHGSLAVDVSGPQLPAHRSVTGGAAYLRFHGLRPGYCYDYSDADLRPWRDHLRRQVGFAYFNNDVGGHAVSNARRLRALLTEPDSAGR